MVDFFGLLLFFSLVLGILGRYFSFYAVGFVWIYVVFFFFRLRDFLLFNLSSLEVLGFDSYLWCLWDRLGSSWSSHMGSFALFLWLFILIVFFCEICYFKDKFVVFSLLVFFFLLYLVGFYYGDWLGSIQFFSFSGSIVLRDWLLIVHPPVVFICYSLSFVLFFYSFFGFLFTRLYVNLIRFLWSMQSFGIFLGSFWAYYELGWGGWWSWDGVEVLSLIPWLSLLCLMHISWNSKLSVFFMVFTFWFSILSSLIVRWGWLDSVHSFSSLDGGLFSIFIFSFFIVFLVYYLCFFLRFRYCLMGWKTNIISLFVFFVFFFIFCLLFFLFYSVILNYFCDFRFSIGSYFYSLVAFIFFVVIVFEFYVFFVLHSFTWYFVGISIFFSVYSGVLIGVSIYVILNIFVSKWNIKWLHILFFVFGGVVLLWFKFSDGFSFSVYLGEFYRILNFYVLLQDCFVFHSWSTIGSCSVISLFWYDGSFLSVLFLSRVFYFGIDLYKNMTSFLNLFFFDLGFVFVEGSLILGHYIHNYVYVGIFLIWFCWLTYVLVLCSVIYLRILSGIYYFIWNMAKW